MVGGGLFEREGFEAGKFVGFFLVLPEVYPVGYDDVADIVFEVGFDG